MCKLYKKEQNQTCDCEESQVPGEGLGHNYYSEVEGTMCAKVMGSLDLRLEYTKENKMGLWCKVLAPQMTKTLGTCKNKITQMMREQFNCKFSILFCTLLSVMKADVLCVL